MSRRVLASFIVVLIAMIAFVEIPLGIQLAHHEREDSQQTANATAQSLAATAEEHLGDSDEQAAAASLHLNVNPGDAVVVANGDGTVIASFGPSLPAPAVNRAIAGESTNIEDRTVAVARIGTAGRDGTIVLARSSESLDRRLGALSAALVAAAIGALILGAVVALALARWIGRPVNGLRRVATEMGAGNLDIRAADVGPPEVRELAADFNVMAERIGGLLENQRAMTSDVSHQLRTPLAALRLRLENLAAEAPTDLQPDLVATLEEINRLSRLADGLLAVARAEDETPVTEPVAVDLVIGERIALWREVAAERSVELADRSSPVVAQASPGHLEQILDNLLANALDAVPPGTSIEVEAGRHDDRIMVSVVDHGPGLSEEVRTDAFQRFSGLGDRSSRSAGLGLAIVGSLTKANHGSVRLDETEGGGLTVTLSLPVAANQV
jgi:signal transduction histidine kinase